jgi:GABA(A) receptor-associated protein
MYQELRKFDDRVQESHRILKKYPHRIPCIIQKEATSKLASIPHIKYLVQFDTKIVDIMMVIRKHLRVEPYHALFFTMNQTVLSGSTTFGSIYETNKEKDGFLYLYYTEEQTFG